MVVYRLTSQREGEKITHRLDINDGSSETYNNITKKEITEHAGDSASLINSYLTKNNQVLSQQKGLARIMVEIEGTI